MKKLLFLFCFIIVFARVSFAQFSNGVQQDNSQTLRQFNGAIKPLLGFILPTLDTANNPASTYYAALTASPMYPGKLFMSTQAGWVLINPGSAGLNFPNTTGKYLTGFNNIFGTLNTDSIAEATKLFWTVPRGRAAISVLSPLVYNSTTGVMNADTSILATKTDLLGGWKTTGNANVTGFLGTNDTASLRFKINSQPFGLFNWRQGFGIISNIGMGYHALAGASLLASSNFAVGTRSMEINAGSNNVAIGDFTLSVQTSGNDNVAIGYGSQQTTTTGTNNTAVGFGSLTSNTTGTFNTSFGSSAGAGNTTGVYNVGVGEHALYAATTAIYNTAVGSSSLYNNVSGFYNVGIGAQSLFDVVTGLNNVGVGYQSLTYITGNNNTAIGHQAGGGITNTGSGGVYVGYQAGLNEPTSNKLYIANTSTNTPLIYGDFTKGYLSINAGLLDTASAIISIRGLKGVLFPRMNTAQAWAIGGGKALSNIAVSTMIYNTDSGGICIKIPGVDSIWSKFAISTGGSSGTGTVNLVATGYGLTGGPITNTGTLLWDSATAYLTSVRRKDSTLYTTVYQNSLKQNLVSLTTSGSGASTFNQASGALNIPLSSGGNTNANVGTAFRFAIPNTNNLKTDSAGFGLINDSLRTNVITHQIDSVLIATKYRLQKSITDSFTANIDTIAHAAQAAGYDSLFVIHPSGHKITFVKLTGGSSPIVLTQASDTSIGFSMPSFAPVSGKTLTLDNSLEFAGTDGTIMTFPSSSTAIPGLSTTNAFTGDVSSARMRSGAINAQSNIVWQSAASISNQTDATSVPSGSSGLSYRVNLAGLSSVMQPDYFYGNLDIAKVSFSSAATGTAKGGTNLLVQAPVFVNGGTSINLLASGVINGKPLFTGTGTDSVFSFFVRGTSYTTDTAWGKTMAHTQNDSTLATTRFVHAAIAAGGSLTAASNVVATNIQLVNTATTTENTVYTGTIPANSIGANGHWDIIALVSYPNNGNPKTFKVKINGTTVLNRVNSTSVADRWFFSIYNRNSTAAQIAPQGGSGQVVGGGTTSVALAPYFFDTTTALPIVVTIQNASAGDGTTTALEALTVVAYP